MPIREEAVAGEKKRGQGWSWGRVFLAVGLSALVLALTAGGWYLFRTPEPLARLRLADGTLVTVEAVTAGPEHRVVFGNRLQRLLLPVVPSGIRDRLGGSVHEYSPGNPDALVVWFQWLEPPAPGWSWRLVSVDENGLECGDARYPNPLGSPAGDIEGVTWELTAAPRRAERLRLRVYEEVTLGPGRLAGEFQVTNPAPGPYPEWTAEPFPLVKQAGDVTFSLLELRTGVRNREPRQAAAPGEEGWTVARVMATRNGKPAPWLPVDMEVSDATGSQWHFGSSTAAEAGEALDYMVKGTLSPAEPAYRLKVEFSRTADYSPEELWTIRGVGIPGKGKANMLGKQRQVNGVPVRLVGITAPGGKLPEKVGHESRNVHAVYLRAAAPMEGVRVTLVEATDGQGRPIRVGGSSRGDGEYTFSFEPGTDVRGADFTFAVHRSRFVEFLAKASPPPR